MNRLIAVAGGLALIALAGCPKKPAPVLPPPNVTVSPVVQQDVFEMRTWVALLNGYQNSEIRAQVSGYLSTQNYKEGSMVKQGDVLFTIDQRPFQAALAQAQADYAKAVAVAQLSQITLSRQTQLYQTKVISQQAYDTSFQDNQANLASVAAAQANVQTAQINLAYCTIQAPFDGVVGTAQAQIGDLVGPGGTATVLTQISQLNPIKVVFSITEQEYLKAATLLQNLQDKSPEQLQSKLELKLANGQDYPQKGRFEFVNRQVNAATGTIQITGIFPNDNNVLRPGLFGRVTAPVDFLKGALLVPQASAKELQGNYMVYTVDPNGVVAEHPVKLGPVFGQMQVVTGKLNPGDKVIVGGVEKVKPGIKVNAQPYKGDTTAPPVADASAQGDK